MWYMSTRNYIINYFYIFYISMFLYFPAYISIFLYFVHVYISIFLHFPYGYMLLHF